MIYEVRTPSNITNIALLSVTFKQDQTIHQMELYSNEDSKDPSKYWSISLKYFSIMIPRIIYYKYDRDLGRDLFCEAK